MSDELGGAMSWVVSTRDAARHYRRLIQKSLSEAELARLLAQIHTPRGLDLQLNFVRTREGGFAVTLKASGTVIVYQAKPNLVYQIVSLAFLVFQAKPGELD